MIRGDGQATCLNSSKIDLCGLGLPALINAFSIRLRIEID